MLIIIVPYRDRKAQKDIFIPHMKAFLKRKNIEYKICFIEQSDDGRPFNLGATKNIGYLEMKKRFANPDNTNLTYCHHNIDILPKSDECIYELRDQNTVYNPYGVKHCYAKIYFYSGEVYEHINGNPNNYWGWGIEDVCMQARADVRGVRTDRTGFEWLFEGKKFMETPGAENTKAWPKGNVDQLIALYYYEAAHRETSDLNGLSNIKYTVLSVDEESTEENVIHIVVNIDMPCDLETRVFTP